MGPTYDGRERSSAVANEIANSGLFISVLPAISATSDTWRERYEASPCVTERRPFVGRRLLFAGTSVARRLPTRFGFRGRRRTRSELIKVDAKPAEGQRREKDSSDARASRRFFHDSLIVNDSRDQQERVIRPASMD
jgi:hypothetical protein